MYRPLLQTTSLRLTTIAIAGCLFIVAAMALSQEHEQPPAHRIPVAVIDIAKVFKEVRSIDEKMQAIKAEMDANQLRRPKAELLFRETQVLGEAYQEVVNVVQDICRQRDIGIVLKFDSEPFNPNDRSSVLKGVNRQIVYTAVPDLTADVVAILNKSDR